jgi:biopolymer transport protein ExbD
MSRRALFESDDDDGLPRRKRGDQETELDITPMIDVTFLLLIFFMVTSTMQGQPDQDVPVARFGKGVPTQNATIIRIIAEGSIGGKTPRIILGESDESEADLDMVRRAVEDAVKSDRMQVIIKADREVPHGFVQEVARTVNEVEGVKFYVGVQDKKGG